MLLLTRVPELLIWTFRRKASLLAGDINHLKELRKKAAEGSEGLFMALDVDEELSIRVRFAWCPLFNQGFYMLWLLAWNAVWFKTSFWSFPSDHNEPRNWTLEGRVKNTFWRTAAKKGTVMIPVSCRLHPTGSKSILDKFSASQDFSLKSIFRIRGEG